MVNVAKSRHLWTSCLSRRPPGSDRCHQPGPVRSRHREGARTLSQPPLNPLRTYRLGVPPPRLAPLVKLSLQAASGLRSPTSARSRPLPLEASWRRSNTDSSTVESIADALLSTRPGLLGRGLPPPVFRMLCHRLLSSASAAIAAVARRRSLAASAGCRLVRIS
jgi:hypothetical protein